jgi:predicted small lipoprotein YifL
VVNIAIISYRVRQRVIYGSITLLLSGLVLSGCGYKGPLYLPPPPDTLGQQTPQSNLSAPVSPVSPGDPTTPADPSLEPAPVVIESR